MDTTPEDVAILVARAQAFEEAARIVAQHSQPHNPIQPLDTPQCLVAAMHWRMGLDTATVASQMGVTEAAVANALPRIKVMCARWSSSAQNILRIVEKSS